MSRKSKGIAAERELIHLLWQHQMAAVRVAGSGSSRYPSCDILASGEGRTFAFECKSLRNGTKYIPKPEMKAFVQFSRIFGAQPWIAMRFNGQRWHFVTPEDCIETVQSYVVSLSLLQKRGLLLEELLIG